MAENRDPRRAPVSPAAKPIENADRSAAPAVRDLPEESLCPSCGHFVGAYEKCPYCGAELKKRMSLKLWRRISVIGAVGGILIMWYAAAKMEPELVQVAAIKETHSNAIVRINGIVTDRGLDAARGMIRLRVADATGDISVVGFQVLPKLQKLGNLPKVGDSIDITGQVQISDQYGTSLFLNIPHRLKILEASPAREAKISQLNDSWINSKAVVSGAVKYASRYGKATITDGVEELVVILDPANLGEDVPELKVGEGVKVTGVIGDSKGKMAIVPGAVEDIVSAEVAVAAVAKKKISEITLEMIDQPVEIEGTVVGFRDFKTGGGSMTLSDGAARIDVPIFASNFEAIPQAEKLKVNGTKVRVRGTVDEYNRKPQVKPGSATDITINPSASVPPVSPAAPAAPAQPVSAPAQPAAPAGAVR
jgi:DNA/RNA endonuclease YhcR with UshA esterase domain